MDQNLQHYVQQLIDSLVESGEEIGLQVAASIDGELAVDAWDIARRDEVRHDVGARAGGAGDVVGGENLG